MIVPDTLDAIDIAMLETLIPEEGRDEAIVTTMFTVIQWIDHEGKRRWRCYGGSTDAVTTVTGLFEMGKLDMIARSDSGLPLHYPE